MTDEFADMGAEVKKKKTVTKKAVAKVEVPEESKKVFDVMFANAVKVGISQTNYFSSEMYDISIKGIVFELRRKDWGKDATSVFTTLYNVIHWRLK